MKKLRQSSHKLNLLNILLIFFALVPILPAQDSGIPKEVMKTFKSNFPGTEIIDGEYEAETDCYILTAIWEKRISEAVISAHGKLNYIKVEINIKELPEKIIKKTKELFDDGEPVQAHKYSGHRKGYDVTIFDGDDEYILQFNENGLLLKKKAVEDETDLGC